MTMRASANRIDMDDKLLQKPVLKDYGETVVTDTAGVEDTGYHLSFDGNDYVDCGNGIDVSGASFSLAVWAKRTATGDIHYICGQGVESNNNGMHIGFRDSDVFTFAFWGNDLNTSATYTDSDWHHWTCTYDASSNERIIYRDGVEVASDTASSDFQGSNRFEIGRLEPSGGSFFIGSLDDFRFYSRTLTPAEAVNLYAGDSISSTGLEGHWKFDDGSGGSAVDSSGNGNNGTITGASWVAGDANPASTAHVIDLTEGNIHDVTLEGLVALTFANPTAAGTAGTLTTILRQDTTGGREVVWPVGVVWPNDTQPTLSSLPGAINLFSFLTVDGGISWFGVNGGWTVFNPEEGLSLTRTEAVGEVPGYSGAEASQDGVWACDITFPNPSSEGLLFEIGGSGIGSWVGIRDSGTTFRLRTSDGTSSMTGSTADTAVLDITDFPEDNATHTVVWDFQINPGRIRLWIDGQFKGESYTSGSGALATSKFSGGDVGGYTETVSGTIPVGEPSADWGGTDEGGGLRFYSNQLVDWS